MSIAKARSILASRLKEGDWLVYNNERMNQRVVDVSSTRDGQVKVCADYGNGGEPATLFFEPDETVSVA